MWPSDQFAVLIKKLQEAQMRGMGNIVTLDLVTVENLWWSIPAGVKTEVRDEGDEYT